MYDSWASRIRLFIKGKKHGRMMLDFIDNDDCDVQATNIILHGLPPDLYALVNHQKVAKDIWDRGETLYEYYWRSSQLINDMHTIGMTMHQHERHANTVRIMRERYLDPLALVANSPTLYNPSQSPQHSGIKAMGLEYGRYGVSKVLDTTYWGFLLVGTTFDIFQDILIPHGYAVSSLVDTAYWLSKQ
ncbi:hypothetical protein Tco_0378760 [Tanacetum coccineum]